MSLVTWACYQDMECEIPVLKCISDDDFITYTLKGANMVNRGLTGDMTSVWDSMQPMLRSLIIKMWISRPDSHKDISHPTPTVDEGDKLVNTDPQLTAEEVIVAKDIIRTAVNQDGVPLFRHAESSMD